MRASCSRWSCQSWRARYRDPPMRRLPLPLMNWNRSSGFGRVDTKPGVATGRTVLFFCYFTTVLHSMTLTRSMLWGRTVVVSHEIRNRSGAPCPLREGRRGGGPPPTVDTGPSGDELVAQVIWASLSHNTFYVLRDKLTRLGMRSPFLIK